MKSSAFISSQCNTVKRHKNRWHIQRCLQIRFSQSARPLYLDFCSFSSNTSSIFLNSSKSVCFRPWNFIDFPKQVWNISVFLPFAFFLPCLMSLSLSPVWYLHDTYRNQWSTGMQQHLRPAGGEENTGAANMAVAGDCKHSWVYPLMLCWDLVSKLSIYLLLMSSAWIRYSRNIRWTISSLLCPE